VQFRQPQQLREVRDMMKPRINHRNCGRCSFPVKASSDHVRACRWAESAVFHWACWIALLAERDQLTTRELMRAMRETEA
jgi:hypothetical protein